MADRTVSVEFIARHQGFTSAVDQMKRNVSDFRSSVVESARTNEQEWRSIGRSAMVAGGVIAGGLGAAVHQFHGFQTEMNRVGALTGATGEKFDELGDLAQELGRTTVFTASQSADALGFLAMAGFDADTAMAALPNTLTLAAAAGMDLAQAADVTTNILTGFGMETTELAHANDVLVATFTNSNTSMEQLGEAMKYAAPLASAAGIDFEEAAAAIGLMGNAGIQGSMAGTSLRGALTRLLNTTPQVQGTLDRLGVSVTDSTGAMLPLADIIEQLSSSGADAGDMMQIFGQRAGPAMTALVSQGSDALREFTGELRTSGGTAEEIADRQLEGLHGSIIRFKSALEGMMIWLGEGLAPMVGFVADVGAAFMSWIGSLPGPIQTAAGLVGGLSSAVLLLGGGFMVALPWALNMRDAVLRVTRAKTLASAATGLYIGAMNGLRTAWALALAAITPVNVAIAGAAAIIGGLVWHLHRQDDAQMSVADSARALADSTGISYQDIESSMEEATESMESSSLQFQRANADVIAQLHELDEAAQSDFLFQMAFNMVQHGADPEEAMAAVEKLRDATDRSIKLDFDTSDLDNVEVYIERIVGRITETWDAAAEAGTGALTAIEHQAMDVAETVRNMLDLGDFGGALASLNEFDRAMDELGHTSQGTKNLQRDLYREIMDGIPGLDRYGGNVRSVNELMEVMADRANGAGDNMRHMAEMFLAASRAGMDTEDALSHVAYLLGHLEEIDAAAAIEDFADEVIGAAESAAALEGPLADIKDAAGNALYSLEKLGGATEENAEKWAALGQSWADVAEEMFGVGVAMERATGESQAAAEAAADAHNDAIDKQIAKLGEGKDETRKSLEGQKKSWEDFADDFPVTMASVTSHLQDVNDEFRDWQSDIQAVGERVGGDFAQRLALMGPEWAPIVAEAVDATAAEIAGLDQAMADNMQLQMAAAELAVQMEILEQVVREGSQATVASVAQNTGIAVETVQRLWGHMEVEPPALDIDIDPALWSVLEAEGKAEEFSRMIAVATADVDNTGALDGIKNAVLYGVEYDADIYEAAVWADIAPAVESFMEANGLGDAWDDYVTESTAETDIDDVIVKFARSHGLADEWDRHYAEADADADINDVIDEFNKANNLADAWHRLRVRATVTADVSQALDRFNAVHRAMSRLPGNLGTSARMQAAAMSQYHDGGWVGDGRRWNGKWKSDERLAVVQDGEYMLSRGMLDGSQPVDPAVLAAINPPRPMVIPQPSGGGGIDTDRLVAALQSAPAGQPVTVNVQAHDVPSAARAVGDEVAWQARIGAGVRR